MNKLSGLRNRYVQVIRPTGAYDGHGRWQEGAAPAPFTINCSVQPVKGHEMKNLPEGRRRDSAFWIFTTFQLRAADDRTEQNPDRLNIGGREYEVYSVEDWQNGMGAVDHFRAMAVAMGQAADGVA